MKWPWSRPEVRSSSYAAQVIDRLLASAGGATEGGALAVIEIVCPALGKWTRKCIRAACQPSAPGYHADNLRLHRTFALQTR